MLFGIGQIYHVVSSGFFYDDADLKGFIGFVSFQHLESYNLLGQMSQDIAGIQVNRPDSAK